MRWNPAWILVGLLCSPSFGAAQPPVAPVIAGETGARLDAFLKDERYTGGALVARGGTILLLQGYGTDDREGGIPFGPDTVFPIGSITKQFTAAAILKLEMQGKLRVTDPLSRFFPDAPADKKDITLHQLLTHTAGLESDFAGDYEEVSRDEYVRRILAAPLRGRPGEAYFYANSGYSLLGAIVELASGQGYEAYLQAHLFGPAGMHDTGYRTPAWSAKRIAQGYREGKRWGTILERSWAPDGPWWALRANGGIHSTLSDMYRWYLALESDVVLSAAARQKAFAPHVPEGPRGESHYGYGWSVFKTPEGRRVIAHDGGNGIFSADFRRYVDDGLVVITASNTAEVKAFKVAPRLARIALGDAGVAETKGRPALAPLGASARHALIRGWFDAFNSGDLATMRAFRAAHMTGARPGGMTEEQRDAAFRRMTAEVGRIAVQGVKEETADRIVVVARAAGGAWVELGFELPPGEAGKIAGIGVEVGEAP